MGASIDSKAQIRCSRRLLQLAFKVVTSVCKEDKATAACSLEILATVATKCADNDPVTYFQVALPDPANIFNHQHILQTTIHHTPRLHHRYPKSAQTRET